MLLIDSNIFIYARGDHPHSKSTLAVIAEAVNHPEWTVPSLVLLEVTHYYRDNGLYADHIRRGFTTVETLVSDLAWAFERSPTHAAVNDHIILASAHRYGATGVITFDDFFDRQTCCSDIRRILPQDVLNQ